MLPPSAPPLATDFNRKKNEKYSIDRWRKFLRVCIFLATTAYSLLMLDIPLKCKYSTSILQNDHIASSYLEP
jgi:hypothetical protein